MSDIMRPAVEIRRHLFDQIIARVESITEPSRQHTVIWTARDGWRCSCVVGLSRRKRCIHIDRVIEEMAT